MDVIQINSWFGANHIKLADVIWYICYIYIYIPNYINIIYPPDKKSAEKSWSFGCVDAFPDDSSHFQGITGRFSDFQDQMMLLPA